MVSILAHKSFQSLLPLLAYMKLKVTCPLAPDVSKNGSFGKKSFQWPAFGRKSETHLLRVLARGLQSRGDSSRFRGFEVTFKHLVPGHRSGQIARVRWLRRFDRCRLLVDGIAARRKIKSVGFSATAMRNTTRGWLSGTRLGTPSGTTLLHLNRKS